MKLNVVKWSLLGAMTLLLSSCASKEGAALEMTNEYDNCMNILHQNNTNKSLCEVASKNQVVFLSEENDNAKYMYYHYNESNEAILQMAAQYTLNKKHNYFAIAYPFGLSNFEGSLIHTAEGYFNQCNIHIGNFVLLNSDPCSLHGNQEIGQIGIVTYENKPAKPLTYEAKAVIEYLTQEDLLIDEIKFTRFGILRGE